MSNLLVISSASGSAEGDLLVLDKKFVKGMRYYTAAWSEGQTSCLLRADQGDALFQDRFAPEALPFDVHLRPTGHRITAADLEGHDVILCSGDNQAYLHIAELCRSLGKAIFFTIEYIPETRRQIIMLDSGRSLPSRMKGLLDIARTERRRRRAFRIASGLQANGYPAAEYYRPINAQTIFYLDNRVEGDLLATDEEMAARRDHLLEGGPLRLIHSGRLEPMKGSQDLIPIARRLRDSGVDFVLDIFGGGSLEDQIRHDITTFGLAKQVRLHDVVDFATELVPYARRCSDIFLSCHRQSDPSCSYLENMGCGLAVAGYGNKMWAALAQDSHAGWVVPLGNWASLADRIIAIAADRPSLARTCDTALDFAKSHLFEAEFSKRIAQMRSAAEQATKKDEAC